MADVRSRRYEAPPTEVRAALTEPESLQRWLAPPPGVAAREVEPERVLELEWRPEGEPPSLVRFELSPAAGGTTLVVDHRRLEERVCMGYMRVWTSRLPLLDMQLAR